MEVPVRESRTRELLRVAWPLILSESCWTVQIIVDRVLLSRAGGQDVGAGMMAALFFWAPFSLARHTTGYATTFVAQYTGAGQPGRIGPVVWQALYLALFSSLAFFALAAFAGPVIALGGHTPELQAGEVIYFRCLCYSALPLLILAAVSGFFAGRGDTRTVLAINALSMVVNAVLDYLWIFGEGGFPAWGIAGAGWATVTGSACGAALGLVLFFREPFRREFATLSGWRPDPALFSRLLKFGLPAGALICMDVLAFAIFLLLVGRLGGIALSATSIAFTLNFIVLFPVIGLGTAVGVVVGQRLGEGRPDEAARSTWVGARLAIGFTGALALVYAFLPGSLTWVFRYEADPAQWAQTEALTRFLLRFVACYCFFDSLNIVFGHALRGAGDTRFVTAAALVLSWPVMIVPTWLIQRYDWGISWAWFFASVYIALLGLTFLARFLAGKWRSMRVIEGGEEGVGEAAPALLGQEVTSA